MSDWVDDPEIEIETEETDWVDDKAPVPQPEESTGRQLVRGAIDTVVPALGAIGGGVLGAGAGPIGAVGVGALGYGMGKEGARHLKKLILDDDTDAKTYGELVTRPLGDMAEGATFEIGGQALGQGIQAAGKGFKTAGEALAPRLKGNADDIIAAAKRLGFTPTPGMIKEGKTLQGLESTLQQSPGMGGWLVRRQTKKAVEKMDEVPRLLLKDSTSLTPHELGNKVKTGIEQTVSKRFEPHRTVFKELAESTPHIPVGEKSLSRVAKNIGGFDEVRLLPGSPAAAAAEKYAGSLAGVRSVKDLQKIRQNVGTRLGDPSVSNEEKAVLNEIYARLTRLEENSLQRGAIDTMRGFAQKPTGKTGDALAGEGEALAKELLDKMRGAKKGFSTGMGELRELSGNARIRGKLHGPDNFVEKIDDIPSEKLVDRLFPMNDQRLLGSVEKTFPEQFADLRQGKLAQIQRGSLDINGVPSSSKFLTQTNKIDQYPESMKMLFGDEGAQKFADFKTARSAFPERIGPSGTPQGNAFFNFANPATHIKDAGNYLAYKALDSKTAERVANFLMRSPKFAKMAQENPQAFQAAVIQFGQKVHPSGAALPKAAGTERGQESIASQEPVSEEDAQNAFIEGN
jgi:hypothetical protein